MSRMTPARVATAAAALFALSLAGPAAAGSSGFTSLYVFGDSLSDAQGGNNSNPLAPNEGGLLTPAPYNDGRVSNGPVAAEYLGGLLGMTQAQQFHYAIAGARTGLDGTDVGQGLRSQVEAFARTGGADATDGGGLFMVWAGGNDLRDALLTANPTASFASAIGNLHSAVGTLYGLGARNFLLPNIPNLGLTPAVLALGQAPSQGASYLTGMFNQQLALAVDGWQASLPDANLYAYDAFTAHTQLIATASQFGFSNTTNGCLVAVAGAAQAQSSCDVSFYVDGIHPTTAAHQILAQGMAAAVPEPESMLLMASGLVALLGLARRRQRASV